MRLFFSTGAASWKMSIMKVFPVPVPPHKYKPLGPVGFSGAGSFFAAGAGFDPPPPPKKPEKKPPPEGAEGVAGAAAVAGRPDGTYPTMRWQRSSNLAIATSCLGSFWRSPAANFSWYRCIGPPPGMLAKPRRAPAHGVVAPAAATALHGAAADRNRRWCCRWGCAHWEDPRKTRGAWRLHTGNVEEEANPRLSAVRDLLASSCWVARRSGLADGISAARLLGCGAATKTT
mmetsp:Transcript_148238/g.385261  ORF Transcript_148238/g.385261 Transcript_148238/m.385261 type:complete len:231 (+) Transcript_148238:1305-1997(+)